MLLIYRQCIKLMKSFGLRSTVVLEILIKTYYYFDDAFNDDGGDDFVDAMHWVAASVID